MKKIICFALLALSLCALPPIPIFQVLNTLFSAGKNKTSLKETDPLTNILW